MRRLTFAIAAVLACASVQAAPTRIPEQALARAVELREQALADDTGWKVVESLTTEVGPRLAGSEADARAVEWAKAKFRALGFDRVWTEPVTFPKWERRSEQAQVLGAHAQPLAITALGGSPAGTAEGEVVRFDSLDALKAAPAGSLAGKIAFIDYQMTRSRSGEDYGIGGTVRSRGPSEAIRKGVLGYIMRSAGTDSRAAYRHHPLRRRPDPGAVGSAVGARRRAAGAAGRARPDPDPHDPGLRLGRQLHLAERDRRNHRPRAAEGSGGDRRPPRLLGPGHRRS